MSLSSYTLNKPDVAASTSKPPGSSKDVVSEFSVKICNHPDKRYSLLRFHAANKLDFTKSKDIRMQRENNFRQYKTAHDIVDMPTEGAGSEYGREQREEARRKKLGFSRRVYNPQYQPWLLSVGKGKEDKRYKGTQEGGISDNVAYFAFVQSNDGCFMAYPISEWYNMTPEIKYRYLKEDEAEEEYTRRHKQLNHFNIMVKKRMNDAQEDEMADNEGDGGDDISGFNRGTQNQRSGKKKGRSFKLTEMEDWFGSSDEADCSDGGDKGVDKDSDEEKKSKKKNTKKRKQKTKDDVDSEGFEDSDLDDHDGDEVDYMTHSSSDEEKLSVEEREKLYKEEGVDQEVALKALLTDISTDEENDEKPSDAEETKEEDQKSKSSKVQNPADSSNSSDNNNSSSSSAEDSDSEIDKKAASAVANQRRLSTNVDNHSESQSTPLLSNTDDPSKSRKRPFPNSGDSNFLKFESASKKSTHASSPIVTNSKLSGLDNAIIAQVETEVRKYLLRKPISAKELLKKIRQKNLVPKNFETSHVLANVLKKLNPQKIKVQGDQKLHLKG